jgi:hypothetical protein
LKESVVQTERIELSVIMQRLQRLENQNRRLKTGGILLLLILGSFAAAAAPSAQSAQTTVQAQRFVLVDASGKEFASLGFDDSDRPGLSLRDAARERVWLGNWGGTEPGIGFFDAEGNERAWIGVTNKNLPRVVLYDPSRKETWSTP